MGKPLLCVISKYLLKFLLIVIINYLSITIKMAVIKSNIAKKYSTIAFFLLFFTKFLIPEPKAAQTDIDIGQIIKAVIEHCMGSLSSHTNCSNSTFRYTN